MKPFQAQLRTVRLRLHLRVLAFGALCGLVAALPPLLVAPWAAEALGADLFALSLVLPIALPLIGALIAMTRAPDEHSTVVAADHWAGAKGAIAAAYELERRSPESPFTGTLAGSATLALQRMRVPEPRLLRRLLLMLAILMMLLPVSRLLHAAATQPTAAPAQAAAVQAGEAERVAQDAALAAQQARELPSRGLERLARDIEQLAQRSAAGEVDKERALREANSLLDRTQSRRSLEQQRAQARAALRQAPITARLAEALETGDLRSLEQAASELAQRAQDPDGNIDPQAAAQLNDAIQEAARLAKDDADLRRAAQRIESILGSAALRERELRELQARAAMQQQGLSEAEMTAALAAIRNMDAELLQRALNEFAQAASGLRDLDPAAVSQMLERTQQGELTPEQAARLSQAAAELMQRLELNAEALREMLREGSRFEGLDQLAQRALQQRPASEGSLPEWAREAASPELQQLWREGTPGQGTGHTPGRGEEGTIDLPPTQPEVIELERTDRVQDPDAPRREIDPASALDEEARIGPSGREFATGGISAGDEIERLPRRYREAARRYLER